MKEILPFDREVFMLKAPTLSIAEIDDNLEFQNNVDTAAKGSIAFGVALGIISVGMYLTGHREQDLPVAFMGALSTAAGVVGIKGVAEATKVLLNEKMNRSKSGNNQT